MGRMVFKNWLWLHKQSNHCSNGLIHTISDFGLNGLVTQVYKHLVECIGGEGRFIATYKSGEPMRLASDTMILPEHIKKWSIIVVKF